MIASAAVRSIIANRSALWLTLRPCSSTNLRASALYFPVGLLCQNTAMWVCSGVRVVLVSEPSCLISFRSAAYSGLVSAYGPVVRNCEELCTMNGTAFATHGVGSHRKVPTVDPGNGCHAPAPAPKTQGMT